MRMGAYSLGEIYALVWLWRRKRKKRKSRIWVHHLNTKRSQFGNFNHLFPDLVKHPEKFYNFFRMTNENFKMLVELIGPSIKKNNTNYRRAIESEEKMAIFLR